LTGVLPLRPPYTTRRDKENPMRVLVAGASGAIGTRLVLQLIDARHEVTGTHRSPLSLTTRSRRAQGDASSRDRLGVEHQRAGGETARVREPELAPGVVAVEQRRATAQQRRVEDHAQLVDDAEVDRRRSSLAAREQRQVAAVLSLELRDRVSRIVAEH